MVSWMDQLLFEIRFAISGAKKQLRTHFVRSLLLLFNVIQSGALFLIISNYGYGMIASTIAANTLAAFCAIAGLQIGRPLLFAPNIFCKIVTGAGLVLLGLQFADSSKPGPTDGLMILWILACLILFVAEINAMMMYCFELSAETETKPSHWTNPPPAYSVTMEVDRENAVVSPIRISPAMVLPALPSYEEAIQMDEVGPDVVVNRERTMTV